MVVRWEMAKRRRQRRKGRRWMLVGRGRELDEVGISWIENGKV